MKSKKVVLDTTDFLARTTYEGTDVENEVAIAQAWINNLIVRYPKPNELFVDLDTHEDYINFYQSSGLLALHYNGFTTKYSESRSGGDHRHLYITLNKEVTPMERILLQLACFSDKKRELLSLDRLKAGNQNPTIFFERM